MDEYETSGKALREQKLKRMKIDKEHQNYMDDLERQVQRDKVDAEALRNL